MRTVANVPQFIREERDTIFEPPLFLVRAKRRNRNEYRVHGFWGGVDPVRVIVKDMFTGNVHAREFQPVNLHIPSHRLSVGLDVMSTAVYLNPTARAVQLCFREDDSRAAECQAWRWCWDARTLTAKDVKPEPWFCGEIDDAPINFPPLGSSEASLEVSVVGLTRRLTSASNRRSSHNQQKRRKNDVIGQYADTSHTWDVPWGAEDRGEE